MMLSLTACGGNATSSTPASVSGSGSESGEQVSEAAKRLEEQKELNIMFVAGNFAESMQKIYADYEKEIWCENQLYDFRSRTLIFRKCWWRCLQNLMLMT